MQSLWLVQLIELAAAKMLSYRKDYEFLVQCTTSIWWLHICRHRQHIIKQSVCSPCSDTQLSIMKWRGVGSCTDPVSLNCAPELKQKRVCEEVKRRSVIFENTTSWRVGIFNWLQSGKLIVFSREFLNPNRKLLLLSWRYSVPVAVTIVSSNEAFLWYT